MIRAIDSSNLKDEYSMAQRVTYRYYVGRKAMFDSDFKQGIYHINIIDGFFAMNFCILIHLKSWFDMSDLSIIRILQVTDI